MSGTKWTGQLEQILGVSLRTEWIAGKELAGYGNASGLEPEDGGDSPRVGNWYELPGNEWSVVARLDGKQAELLIIGQPGAERLTETERRLVSWTLHQLHGKSGKRSLKAAPGSYESEQFAEELGAWIQGQIAAGVLHSDVPDHMSAGGKLFADMIPFLLTSEYEAHEAPYFELEKLLKSFFADEVLLIPLKEQEWLVLSPSSLLRDSSTDDRSDEDGESTEDALASICSGLHDMLVSEWVGECHVAVAHSIVPAKSVLETVVLLRETLSLGRKFHVGSNIHLPWLLHLERLLNSIQETHRARYLEQVLQRTDVFLEPEIMMTLETFFSLDCNVSETAKRLYIHRNTLLYRLDKLKQETGLDVRSFNDAVLVKIILLLYKVTKRK